MCGGVWGGGVISGLGQPHPHQKNIPQENNAMSQRGPNFEADVRHANLVRGASDRHPPPPRTQPWQWDAV